tara:strand:+ start:713 stop:1111 length:399 start_codon:yes stop_codon:yes gene_type:complete
MLKGYFYLFCAFLSLIFMCLSMQSSWSAAWNEKPIMCASHEETFSLIAEKEEKLMWSAIQFTKVKGPNDTYREDPEMLVSAYYLNLNTRTYTVLEYHPKYLVYCVTSWGTDVLLPQEIDPNTYYRPDRGVFQ